MRYENVLWANAPMNDVFAVEILEAAKHRLCYRLQRLLVETQTPLLIGSVHRFHRDDVRKVFGVFLAQVEIVYAVEYVLARAVIHERVDAPYLRIMNEAIEQRENIRMPNVFCP